MNKRFDCDIDGGDIWNGGHCLRSWTKFVFVVERFDFIFHRLCSVVIIVSFGLILSDVSFVCGGWTRDRERQCSRKNNTDLWAMREGRVFQCGPPHPPRQLQHEDSDRQMRGRQVA